MASSRTIFTVASITVLGGLLAYAVYFDYKRRNDVEFRRRLKKDKKRVDKQAAASNQASQSSVDIEEIRAALAKIKDEEVPTTPEQRELFFMTQVSTGEQLCTQGPMFHLPAALAFYRALRVYPSPVELLQIYQKTVPPPVFQLVITMTNLDVKARVEGYFDTFPPKSMNVSVQSSPKDQLRKILVAEKDFEEGDVIYKELPVIAVLDADLEGQGKYCSHCLRSLEGIDADTTVTPASDRLGSVYCSSACHEKAKVQSQNLLFGLESVLPPELDNGLANLTKGDRDGAQAKFTEFIKKEGRSVPLLTARFVARQVAIESAKLVPGRTAVNQVEILEGTVNADEYSLYDHMERLRFVDGKVAEDETKMLCAVLGAALPGLEQSVNEERHATYHGKLAYNAIGVYFGNGRDDKPAPTARPEDQERMRTPVGTSRQVGSGLFPVSAYIAHSCDPSAKPVFSSGNYELSLVANKPIKKGEQITMAYVDVSQHDIESEEARRRRRFELARGWRFKCTCDRCEAEETGDTEVDLGVDKDESKVEDVVRRVESGQDHETFL
ncbi:MAS20-domain-containing protein [Wolfiporia cocos MD-104 SS10]|uniref:MAS20-domain-containing protein n=1 Tax=Wolfiporia cocos (strain MD-104) TaxID=742152 RepID=A0A2H3JH38_WOLCO|nr:MAS20-domain-containing protein [Wolfiporia cocos MD-104 SS10]